MSVQWDLRPVAIICDLINGSTVKYGSREFDTEVLSSPTQHGLIDLPQVHTAGYTQRVQHHIYRCSILKEWHILGANDLGYNTFVTVTAGHFITHFQLTLNSQVNLGQLQYTRR